MCLYFLTYPHHTLLAELHPFGKQARVLKTLDVGARPGTQPHLLHLLPSDKTHRILRQLEDTRVPRLA